MRRIRQELSGALGRPEVLRTAKAQAILRRWVEVVGPEMYNRSRPSRYTNGTVWVAVEGSAWAQELRFQKDAFLERLHAMAGDPTLFVDIRFGVRPLPAEDEPVETVDEEAGLPRNTPLSIQQIKERRLAKRRNEKRD